MSTVARGWEEAWLQRCALCLTLQSLQCAGCMGQHWCPGTASTLLPELLSDPGELGWGWVRKKMNQCEQKLHQRISDWISGRILSWKVWLSVRVDDPRIAEVGKDH